MNAGLTLAQGGVYGLVWVDEDLHTTAKFGQLVDTVEVGEPLTQSLPALFGYEKDIRALRNDTTAIFALPSFSMPTRDLDAQGKTAPRLNLSAFWSPTDERYLLLVARAFSASKADQLVSQQMRKRLMAEEALAQKTRELEVANCDLEEYAEIISHDLSAPLRAIRYLSDDIETALENESPTNARKHLADLREQSQRMSQMMSALLDYASLGRKSEVLEPVDTNELVHAIARSLPHPESLELSINGTWPTVKTLRAPLDLVIRNLTDNAIKHHDTGAGTITLEAMPLNSESVFEFCVTDDGPGIDPKHHGAIMLPFRTLGTGDTTSSRGIGLALVNRTVASMGGRLTLISNPEDQRGTKFTVSWPLPKSLGA